MRFIEWLFPVVFCVALAAVFVGVCRYEFRRSDRIKEERLAQRLRNEKARASR